MQADIQPVALHEAAQRRYLSYALSVITSRALPDVRDGLKPVQRRILYAMLNNLRLTPEGRFRKSAAVVGEVMAKYHPHGDQSIYDAMVRMAQPFSLLHPLVDGQGNFGSLDGDPPAAMRYTEAKLRPLAIELLTELKKETVAFRPTYDGQVFEPVVLPARFPQLLVNGVEGIAVGMATRIPPHNLREIIDACVLLLDEPDCTLRRLCGKVKGPDFPVGGQILDNRDDLRTLYECGGGPVNVRAEWTTEQVGRRHYAVVTSLPYAVNKATLIERIGGHIAARKVPQLLDVRDESTDDIRVVLELRKASDAVAAMAWLFKHTALQQRYHVNLTCLVPTDNPQVSAPARLDLKTLLRHWLDFRIDTVRKRFQYDLKKLRERIHILEGFEILFDDLDEAIRLIRQSEGKRDAAEKLMDRFDLDDDQAEAILQLRLYKIAKLEILSIRQELAEARAEAARIEAILRSQEELERVVKDELLAVRKAFGQPRRTRIGGGDDDTELSYSEDAYIVSEDAWVIVTREGWLKRQTSFTAVEKIRVREGDEVAWLFRADTRSTVSFLTTHGTAYTVRVDDVVATTGYGEPIQARFNFDNKERVIGVLSHTPQNLPTVFEGSSAGVTVAAVTTDGRGLRFQLSQHAEVSTRSGRRFCRTNGDHQVLAAYAVPSTECWVSVASTGGNALTFPVQDLKLLGGAGKGITAMKLNPGDRIIAFELTCDRFGGARVVTTQGREEVVRPSKFLGRQGARGRAVLRRGGFGQWLQEPHLILPEGEE